MLTRSAGLVAVSAALFLAPLAAAQKLRELEGVKLYLGCLHNYDAAKASKPRQIQRLTLAFCAINVYFPCL
jgi:hypothetical protein